jgi:hypothetical protein
MIFVIQEETAKNTRITKITLIAILILSPVYWNT